MTQSNSSISPSHQTSLGKRMIIGAGIGLSVILIFIIPSDENPTWGKLWMIRPLIVVPFAGAMGGLCNYYILKFHSLVGLNKIVAIILSAVVFLFGLWVGIVLGLDGTLWD